MSLDRLLRRRWCAALARVGEDEWASAELRLAEEQCARMGATTLLAEAEVALSALDVR